MSSQTSLPSILKSSPPPTRKSFKFGSTTTISVGKDNTTFEVMSMAPVSSNQFMRSTCYEHLIATLHDNRSSFSPSKLTAAISNALPISTTTASDTAHHICSPVLQEPFKVSNLNLLGFRNFRGNEIQIKNDFITNRPEDMRYAYLECNIDPSPIDVRIKQPPFVFSFCLRLPQTTQSVNNPSNPSTSATQQADQTAEKETPNNSPTQTSTFASIFSELEDDIIDKTKLKEYLLDIKTHTQVQARKLKAATHEPSPHDPSTPPPIKKTTSSFSAATDNDFNPLLSPKMSNFLGTRGSASTKLVTTYFGSLDFLDNQTSFDSVFGKTPILLHVNRQSTINAGESIENTNAIPKMLHNFFLNCKYDVFIAICRDDYVGANYLPNDSHAVQAICSKIQSYTMSYTVGTVAKVCHPNDLYTRYLSLATSLPKNSNCWNIVLCTTYYNALTDNLRNKMLEENFQMPSLQTLNSKTSQLNALRFVKDSAAKSYKNMVNEETRIAKMLEKHSSKANTSRVHFTSEAPETTTNQNNNNSTLNTTAPSQHNHNPSYQNSSTTNPPPIAQTFNYQSQSLAETTLQKYSSSLPPTPFQSKFKQHIAPPTTDKQGQKYPHDPANPSNISDFPITFRSCLGCGHTDHYNFKLCPFRNVPGMATQFWKNLWLHKPHTKTKEGPIPNTPRPFPIPYIPSSNLSHNLTNPNSDTTAQASINAYQQSNQQNNTNQQSKPHGLGRGVAATTPAWMTGNISQQQQHQHQQHQNNNNNPQYSQENSKRSRLFITTAQIFNQATSTLLRPMPLDIDNGLPAIEFPFGRPNKWDYVSFTCHIDSCAAMNTGNLLVHQWIISSHPEMVVDFVMYNNSNPFQPVQLLCALKNSKESEVHTQAELDVANSLCAIVRYRTPFFYNKTGKPCIISFGLGDNVTVNSILGLPQLKEWNADMLFSKNLLVATNIDQTFSLEYSATTSGLPNGVSFTKEDFKDPTTGPVLTLYDQKLINQE